MPDPDEWQHCPGTVESCLVHTVVALALPDVVAFDLAIPAQVFGHRTERERYHFTVCAPVPGPVPTSTGFAVHADRGLEALARADTVVVPGYWPPQHPGEPVVTALQAAAARGARMVSVCTGAFALAAAGLLDGRRATTHWHAAAALARHYPRVLIDPDVLWVEEGQVLTSAGVAAGPPGAPHRAAGRGAHVHRRGPGRRGCRDPTAAGTP